MRAAATLTYVGHATILIEMDGVRILTDPLLRSFIGPLRRQVPAPDPDSWKLDAVLISHLHGDHLDLPSLKLLGRDVQMIVPRGAGPHLRLRRFRHVEEIEEGEVIDIGGVKVSATPADHVGRHLPWTPLVEPLGYVIDGAAEIYFAGDTDLFPEMSAIGIDLDIALLPVWGWGPNLGKGHMDPYQAAQALTQLRPSIAIPIHWGTYCPVGLGLLKPRFLSGPPLDFADHAAEVAPQVTVHILEPGQSFDYVEGS